MASPSGGLFEETFMATRNLTEVKIPNNPKPYLQGVEMEPISFPFSFYIEDWARANHREIARWLYQNQYKPMVFDSHPNRIVYAILESDSRLRHNGMDGYVETNVRTNSPWVYGFPTETEEIEVDGTYDYFILNSGDNPLRPKMWLRKVGDGDITIINNTNGQRVVFEGISSGEELFVDFKREEIVSSLEEDLQVYRYNNHNDVWLQLETEENDLRFEGRFDVIIQYQLEYLNFWGE